MTLQAYYVLSQAFRRLWLRVLVAVFIDSTGLNNPQGQLVFRLPDSLSVTTVKLVTGRGMAQAVSRRLVNAEHRVRSESRQCGICGQQVRPELVFLRVPRLFPVSIIPLKLYARILSAVNLSQQVTVSFSHTASSSHRSFDVLSHILRSLKQCRSQHDQWQLLPTEVHGPCYKTAIRRFGFQIKPCV